MFNMDVLYYIWLCKIIFCGFMLCVVGCLYDEFQECVQKIVVEVVVVGFGDFVEQVFCELLLQVIVGLLGVLQEDCGKLFYWLNEMIGNEDLEYVYIDLKVFLVELIGYMMKMVEEKVKNFVDDIVIQLI